MIKFYSSIAEYGFLSNFSVCPIELDEHRWPTVVHYYSAQKFPQEATIAYDSGKTVSLHWHILCQPVPKMALQEGDRRDFPIRPDWQEIREAVMLKALRAKFTQHADLREKLLATGEEELVFDSPNEFYWGCGPGGRGQNRLGRLLMQVRDELRDS